MPKVRAPTLHTSSHAQRPHSPNPWWPHGRTLCSPAIAHAEVAVADTAAGLAIRPDGTRRVGDASQARLVCAVGQLLLGALGTHVRACRIDDVRAVICVLIAPG